MARIGADMVVMSPEQIELVERTLAVVRPRLGEVSAEFYRRLFAAEPGVVELFGSDPAAQEAKLAEELEYLLVSIGRYDEFRERARDLGARHVGYGARAGHYGVAGAALLAAVATAVGEGWTAEVEQAWRLAYKLTAEVMMDGAAGDGAGGRPSPSGWPRGPWPGRRGG
jgi:hemoglobin-like flavoprotein